MEIQEYYADIEKTATQLDPDAAEVDRRAGDKSHTTLKRSSVPVWLMSVANRPTGSIAGQAVEMHAWHAAERIVNGTHRLATPEEVKAEIERREKERERILNVESDRKGQTLPPQITQMVTAVAATLAGANLAAAEQQKATNAARTKQ